MMRHEETGSNGGPTGRSRTMRHLIAAAAALALIPGAALAKDLPAGGLTLEEIATWLQGEGYKAEIQTADDGSRNIYSSSDGGNFHIDTYDCKEGRCGSLQFSVGFATKGASGAGPMNDWNRKNRWTHAYADDVNDPWLAYDVDLSPGGTYEMLDDQFGIWRDAVIRFRKYINWTP